MVAPLPVSHIEQGGAKGFKTACIGMLILQKNLMALKLHQDYNGWDTPRTLSDYGFGSDPTLSLQDVMRFCPDEHL